MNLWNIIKRFLFSKVPSYFYLILLFIFAYFLVTGIYNSHCKRRILHTKHDLIEVRDWIIKFKVYKKRYPESIQELRKYVAEKQEDKSLELIYTDFKKNKQSIVNEFDTLNDRGGYYYNKATGEVRVNLTKPVKQYLKCYGGIYRDEVPAEW